MSHTMVKSIDVQVECEGRYTRGTKEAFDKSFGNYLPPEHGEVEDFKVYICRQENRVGANVRLNITDLLSEKQVEELKSEYIELMERVR